MDPEPAASAADTARAALRSLAYATQAIDEPSDSYAVLGSLHAGLSSLRQSIDQLADWHARHAPMARSEGGDLGREVAAELAAAELWEAAGFLERANARVSAAWSHNGRVVWQPEPPASRPAEPARQLASVPSFGAPGSAHREGGLLL